MIRVQPLDGPWQTLGADLYPGRWPEDINPVWGPSGPEALTFSLRRPPYRVHADLLPFTPVELYPGDRAAGEPIWSGYTMQSPPGSGGEATSVSCRGWHFYRDEDPRAFYYVHADLAEWQDARSQPWVYVDDLLGKWELGAQVSTVASGITIGWAKETALTAGRRVGVILDLGPGQDARRIVVDWERRNINSTVDFKIGTGPDLSAAWPHQSTTVSPNDANDDVTRRDLRQFGPGNGLQSRYIGVYLETSFTGVDSGFDHVAVLRRIRVFRSTAWATAVAGLTGGESALTLDDVVNDTSDRLTPLLSSDRSRVLPTTFAIPELKFLQGEATAREAQDAANDYHGYRVGVDAARRPFALPQPSWPRLQVDARAQGVKFRDLSTNDGEEVYNRVSVRGRDGSGDELRLIRYLAEYVPGPTTTRTGFSNPSFDTDASGWTNVTRVTAAPLDSGPGSGEANGGANDWPYSFMTGDPFEAGVLYRATGRVYLEPGPDPPGGVNLGKATIRFGTLDDYGEVPIIADAVSPAYATVTVPWVPETTELAADVLWMLVADLASFDVVRVDTFTLTQAIPGLLERRHRVRGHALEVAAGTSLEALDALAQAFLLAHRFTPFRGSLEITGSPVIDLASQAPVRADELGRYYGEMLRVIGVPDPDTGGLNSRDGTIASVNGLEPASVAIDTERRSLEALMARMQVVRG